MNSQFPDIDYLDFKVNSLDFEERDANKLYQKKMPRQRGKFVKTTAFFDASFGLNKKNCKSFTGHVILVNGAPILWYRKSQKMVETSAFSAEHVSLKTCVEAIEV